MHPSEPQATHAVGAHAPTRAAKAHPALPDSPCTYPGHRPGNTPYRDTQRRKYTQDSLARQSTFPSSRTLDTRVEISYSADSPQRVLGGDA